MLVKKNVVPKKMMKGKYGYYVKKGDLYAFKLGAKKKKK